MLQFIAETNNQYSIEELTQMAIEGGCQWIVLRVPNMSDAEIREIAQELVPLCKETSTILTIEDHVDLARELGLHGVHLTLGSRPAAAVREELGPEAIIGAEIGIASAAIAMQGMDIDYVSFPSRLTIEQIGEEIAAIRGADCDINIVAEGNYTAHEAARLRALGANGVAIGQAIADSKDPVEKTKEIISALNN